MTASAAHLPAPEPLFLDGCAGRLFALYQPPVRDGASRGAVLCLPPFAEEMNRARRMAALQARALATAGHAVLLLDLFGTGESDGDFADARWPIWLDDVARAAEWLAGRNHAALDVLGLRFGAMLAAAAAAAAKGRFRRLVLWQPVADGKAMLTQFLRLKVAAAMAGEGGESTDRLRAGLAAGEPLEIAGYTIAPELAAAVDGLRLDAFIQASGSAVDWLEVVAEADRPLSPAARRLTDIWRERGVAVSAATVTGPQFWATQEITVVPALLLATVQALSA